MSPLLFSHSTFVLRLPWIGWGFSLLEERIFPYFLRSFFKMLTSKTLWYNRMKGTAIGSVVTISYQSVQSKDFLEVKHQQCLWKYLLFFSISISFIAHPCLKTLSFSPIVFQPIWQSCLTSSWASISMSVMLLLLFIILLQPLVCLPGHTINRLTLYLQANTLATSYWRAKGSLGSEGLWTCSMNYDVF